MIIDLSGGLYLTEIPLGSFESLGAGLPPLDPNRQFVRCDVLIGKLDQSIHLIKRDSKDTQLITRKDFGDHLIKRIDPMEVIL